MALKASMPQVAAPLVTFAAYAIRSQVDDSEHLSTVTAFTSLAIVSLITNPTVNLLSSIPALRAAEGCINRIQKFLLSSNINRDVQRFPGKSSPNNVTEDTFQQEMKTLKAGQKRDGSGLLIQLEGVDIRPTREADLLLQDVSVGIKEATLTMIVGPIGSGKSTFLKALIGETVIDRGSLSVWTSSMAYCSQTPWLPNGSFRTVLCGPNRYEETWYKTVMHACDLERDMKQFAQGDETLIGSRGAILSGGQRQRLVCTQMSSRE